MALKDRVTNMFVSKTIEDLGAVSAKLDLAEAAVASIEAERSERLLDFALSEDDQALGDVENRLTAARTRCESLRLALEQAQRREDQRLAASRAAQETARRGTAKTHATALAKAAAAFSEATQQQYAAYLDAIKAGDKLQATLTAQELRWASAGVGLREEVRKHLALEVARIGRPASGPQSPAQPAETGVLGVFDWPALIPYGVAVYQIEPADVLLRRRFIDQLQAHLSGAPPAPVAAEPQRPAALEPEAEAFDSAVFLKSVNIETGEPIDA